MRILSFGAGAIGTYIGGSLAMEGHSVVFLEQPQAVDGLRASGLKLNLAKDKRRKGPVDFRLTPPVVEFSGSLDEALQRGPFDLAVFALKSYDTPAALDGMRPFIDQLPPIFCLQNGVDNEPAIAALVGQERVIPGTVTSAVGRRGIGDIALEKLRGVGVAAGHSLSAGLVENLNDSCLRGSLFQRPADMKWSKMLTNLLANPTSAILDMTAEEVFAHPGLYRLEVAQLRECLAVMKAQGIAVVDLPGTPVRALAFAAQLPTWLSKPFLSRAAGSGRGGKMPSFHIDLHSGRKKSEVFYLHGAVARAGQKFGVPTPVNTLLTGILMDMTSGKIALDQYARQPEKLLAGF